MAEGLEEDLSWAQLRLLPHRCCTKSMSCQLLGHCMVGKTEVEPPREAWNPQFVGWRDMTLHVDDESWLQGRDIFYHGRHVHKETFFDSIHCITAWRLIPLNVPWASWGNPCAASQPKLMLQPFIGDITAWTTFWDSYESAIHENNGLSDIDKFNYLRSLLERTAYEAIAGLTLTAWLCC